MQHVIVNIGRSLGSGGYMIAKNIAGHYGFGFYDKELILIAAKDSGISPECFEKVDERQKKGFMGYIFSSFSDVGTHPISINNPLSEESLFCYQSKIIIKLAAEKSCVFVGRCADYILRDIDCCINIFCYAPLEFRIKNVAERMSISLDEAAKKIKHVDSTRSSYYNYFTNKVWGVAESYHLLVDTSLLGIDKTGEFLFDYIDTVSANFK